MERYDYMAAVESCVRDYVNYELNMAAWYDDKDGLRDYLNDELFCNDSVTGNASGSFFCNRWKAEEALAHNFDLLSEVIEEYGDNGMAAKYLDDPEGADVSIRRYLLGAAIESVLGDMEREGKFEEPVYDDMSDRDFFDDPA